MGKNSEHSILIVGAGIAGLSTALRLADAGHRPAVITKTALNETASYHAQGGIAAVMGPEDSLSHHQADTVQAGAGLCHSDVVRQVVSEGPECIRWLEGHGVRFTRGNGGSELHLTREGGHSRRRIVHADDATGRAVMGVLAQRVRRRPDIELLENRFAANLLTSRQLGLSGPNRCLGLTLIDTASGDVETRWTDVVVLATGGASGVYRHATNGSTGDGIAMAWRAGCRISNMEFVQFHPSCLRVPGSRAILITEALRGEGARLLLPDGTRFMARHDERLELAPRDIVSRAIVHEMSVENCDHVLLDISHKPAAEIRRRFPNILATCRAFGLDLTAEPIPVVPAAHYTCGGVVTDSGGGTDIRRLYAAGEVGCTGLHGANRLASNSLLEALAFAKSVSARIDERIRRPGRRRRRPKALVGSLDINGREHAFQAETSRDSPQLVRSFDIDRHDRPYQAEAGQGAVRQIRGFEIDRRDHGWARTCAAELRRVMWEHVGIVRTRESLAEAARRLGDLQRRIDDARDPRRLHPDVLELENQVTVSRLIAEGAARRHESRGLHYNVDYPRRGPLPKDSALRRPRVPTRQTASR